MANKREASPPNASSRHIRPGTFAFTAVLSMSMATMALSIDTVLPAFADIRTAMGLQPDSTAVAGLITAFIVGNGLGLLPAGLLADRYGRRPVLWGGLSIFVVAALAASVAPNLETMLAARLVWGLGSSGPRVAAMAMVRDTYEGEQMAKQMSAIMAVFILVPAIAPSLATVALLVGPWQIVYWMCAAAAALVMVWALRLPATMPADVHTSLSASGIWRSCKTVFTTPGTWRYLVALTALNGAFFSYLGSTEIILEETFGLGGWLPVIFGVFALCMGVGMLFNGQIVERVGLSPLIRRVLIGYIAAAAALVAVAVVSDGQPSFWLYAVIMPALLGFSGVASPNINSAAMLPLAQVAGVASALLGMIPSVCGALIGSRIDAAFDGTILPFAVAFLASGIIAAVVTPETWHRAPDAPVTTSVSSKTG